MTMKSSLIAGASVGVLFAVGVNGAQAETSHHHHHKRAVEAAEAAATASQVQALTAEVEELKARLDAETAARQQVEAQATAASAQASQVQAQVQAAQDHLDDQVKQLPEEVATAVDQAKPKTDKIYYKGITVTMGGFAAAEGVYRSHDETADIGSSYAKMPFANDRAGRTASTTLTGRQSRYSLLAQGSPTPHVQISFYGEFDFLGAAQTANSNESNSYQLRIRNLYGQVDTTDGWHLLAGQSWSLATLNANGITPRSEVIPSTIEAQYVPGFVWARQPQVRLTKDFGDGLWVAASAENPQTTFGNAAVASGVTITDSQAPTSQFFNGTNYSLNNIPDFIGKVAFENKIGGHQLHAEVFGIYRSYLDRVTIAPTATNQAGLLGYAAGTSSVASSGGGVGGSVTFTVVPKVLDLQGSFLTGNGVGRYGSGQLPDVTAEPNGKFVGIPETMWLAGGTLHATRQLDIYVYGGEEADRSKTFSSSALPATAVFGYGTLPGSNNAGCIVEGGTCSAVTKSIEQVTAGIWDKIYQGNFGRLQVGLQYSHTVKQAFADAATGFAPKATEDMVFTSFRYYPF